MADDWKSGGLLDQTDRRDFVRRLGALVEKTMTSIYAWALMSNHVHILLCSGALGLAKFACRRFIVGNGTPKREASGPVACRENEDSLRARRESRSKGRRGRSPSGSFDLRGFEDSVKNFIHLVNSVPVPTHRHGLL